jgi:hypothetical protein
MSEFRQFNGLIGPENLLGLLRNTAPFLFPPAAAPVGATRLAEQGGGPAGWRRIIDAAPGFTFAERPSAAERVDYFALCLACHFASVATFIPTDVDAKIRGVLWNPREDRGALRAMADLALAARAWEMADVSTRLVEVPGIGTVSGHDGEWLGVVSGALGSFLAIGDDDYAQRLHAAIVAELEREAEAFRRTARAKDRELDVLRLATVLTHNVGDVDQGLSFWPERLQQHAHFAQLNHLAHENAAPFGGAYQVAAALYKRLMAAEGHRNYPLRTVKALRTSPALLLPIGPFLDDWGRIIATHQALSPDDRGEVVAALLGGCKKIAGQVGYYRALAGIDDAVGGLDQLARRLPGAARGMLKDAELRRHLAIKQVSFESAMRKKAAAMLIELRQR